MTYFDGFDAWAWLGFVAFVGCVISGVVAIAQWWRAR